MYSGSFLHKQLQHLRRLYQSTQTRHRLKHGPWSLAEGSARAFPIECSACKTICKHCGVAHYTVCYPCTSRCGYVTQDGKDHTQCPTLLADPLKSPSLYSVKSTVPRCEESKRELYNECEYVDSAEDQLISIACTPSVSIGNVPTGGLFTRMFTPKM